MSVELFPAWEWICPSCEQNNFASAITMEISPSDPQYDALGGSEGHGMWMSQPETVACKHCGQEFEVAELEEME